MAIITKPTVITKGIPAVFHLNKNELAALPSVDANTYYRDQTNWKKVVINYGSSVNHQFHVVSFDPAPADPIGTFLASDKAEDIFNVISISIIDFDNGAFRVPSTELDSELFRIDMSGSYTRTTFLGLSSVINDAITFDATDPSKMIYATAANNIGVDTIASYIMPLNATSGTFNADIYANLKDTQIQCFHANSDLTKAWVIGQFGTLCNGKTLPPETTGINYISPIARLVEIDMVTGDVSLKYDIPNGGVTPYFSTIFKTLTIDEATNSAFICDGYRLARINMTTSSVDWFNYMTPVTSYTIKQSARMYQDSTSIYIQLAGYKGVPVADSIQVYKLNKSDGERDLSLPDIPLTGGVITDYSYSISPDVTKIVMGQSVPSTGKRGFRVFSGGSWGAVTSLEVNVDLFLYCSDSSLYVYGKFNDAPSPYWQVERFSFAGAYEATVASATSFTGYNLGTYLYPSFAVDSGKVYCMSTVQATGAAQLLQFAEDTGLRNNGFVGSIAEGSPLGRLTLYTGNRIISDNYYDNDYIPQIITPSTTINYGLVLMDTAGQAVIHSQTFTPPIYVLQGPTMSPMTSTLYPNKVFLASSGNFSVIDTSVIPFVDASAGWPTRGPLDQGWYGSAVIDGYMYFYGYGRVEFIDSVGTYTTYHLARMDLATKIFDRSFDMSGMTLATNAYPAYITSTDNYIYVSFIGAEPSNNGKPVAYRVKKSDNSIEYIDQPALGLTSIATTNMFRFVQIGTNKIVVYIDKYIYNYGANIQPQNMLDGRIYIILDEDTLALSGPQIAADSSQVAFRLIYNPAANTLDGIIRTSAENKFYFAKFDLTTNTRVLISVLGPTLNNFDPISGTGYNSSMTFSLDAIFMSMKGSLAHELLLGVVRMDPIGIINNG